MGKAEGFCAAAIVALLSATSVLAQAPTSQDTGTSTTPTGNQISNKGRGSGTGAAPTERQPENGKNADLTGVNEGAGSGTGTKKPLI